MVNLAPPKLATLPARRPTHSGFQAVLLLVVIVLFAWFIVLPTGQSLGNKQEQVKQSQAELKDIEDNAANLQSLITVMNAPENNADLESLDEALPIDERISKVHLLLDQIVRASGMTLANVSVDGGQPEVAAGAKDDVQQPFRQERKQHVILATLGVTGNIEQGVGLMQLLENSARIIDVASLDVTSDGSGTLSFRFKLKMYYYAPATASSTPPAGGVQ